MNMKKSVFLFFSCLAVSIGWSQNLELNITKAVSAILIDGDLSDSAWGGVQRIDGFNKSKPVDGLPAESRTEVLMTYDDQFIYVAAICHDDFGGDYIVQSLKRDFSFPRTDAFGVFLDTYADGINGYSFACSAVGAQREGVLEVGGRYGVTTAWDNKWYSAVTQTKDKWIVEMAIPLKSVRYNEGTSQWKINFARNDQRRNETSTWVPVPFNFNVANLAYTADLNFEEPLKKIGSNVSVIPYVSSGVSKNQEAETPIAYTPDLGFDAKIGITSGLNLDVTFNPDFSTVEVDQQVTNLHRFEVGFQERRQFFMENLDLFGSLGSGTSRPYYSRRIGLGLDSNGLAVETPILAGARLSGKLDKNWRIGLLNVQTKANEEAGSPANNYTMGIIQRRIWKRSNVSAFAVNRQAYGNDEDEKGFNTSDYNRSMGAEFKYLAPDGKHSYTTYLHAAYTGGDDGNDRLSYGSVYEYDTKENKGFGYLEYVGADFIAETGFVRRSSYYKAGGAWDHFWYPKNKRINYLKAGVESRQFWDLTGSGIEWYGLGRSELKFMNSSAIQLIYGAEEIELQFDFDPSRSGGEQLISGTRYAYEQLDLKYISDERKSLFFTGQIVNGGYYNGTLTKTKLTGRYRILPKTNVSVEYTFNRIELPEGYSDAQFHLLGPRVDVSFTTKVFFTTYLQYNTLANNVNLNTRLQWRFKPASDLFIVYSDNYFPENFKVKNRALVFKLSYWFNL